MEISESGTFNKSSMKKNYYYERINEYYIYKYMGTPLV